MLYWKKYILFKSRDLKSSILMGLRSIWIFVGAFLVVTSNIWYKGVPPDTQTGEEKYVYDYLILILITCPGLNSVFQEPMSIWSLILFYI